jgi:hypothetical protein
MTHFRLDLEPVSDGEKVMVSRILMVLGLLAGIGVTPALAASYKFELHNESKYEITGFQTFEDGKWSTWSDVNVAPGETQSMDWNSSEGDCVVPFRIVYKDVETEQYKVDWCKIGNIRVHDDSVTAD